MKSESMSTAKMLVFVIVIASLAAVAAVLVQILILGKSNAGVSGGVAGAIGAGVAVSIWKMKSTPK